MCFKITLQRFRERQVNMKRISDECFVKTKPNKDNVIAIKICNGEMLFIGWMENAESYSIQLALNRENCRLDILDVIGEGDLNGSVNELRKKSLYVAITTSDGYNNLTVIDNEDGSSDKSYETFLSFINKNCSEEDHDIFELTEKELIDICDVLINGEYIFVVDDFAKNI